MANKEWDSWIKNSTQTYGSSLIGDPVAEKAKFLQRKGADVYYNKAKESISRALIDPRAILYPDPYNIAKSSKNR